MKSILILAFNSQVPVEQSVNYGCLGINRVTGEVVHYIDKPETFVSRDINGGVYIFATEIFRDIGKLMQKRNKSITSLE